MLVNSLNHEHKMSDLMFFFFILFKGITPLFSSLLPLLHLREDSRASSHFYIYDGDILGLLSIRCDPFSQIESHSETVA